ncbi:MAG: hypothetical protein ACR2QV_05520 [Gammaproteobacteria bacterium]
MEKTFTRQLREEFDVPGGIAIGLIASHLWVLAMPLVMMWAVITYADALLVPLANPMLVVIASALYIGSTSFEVAQNAADRWYLTEATRSGADLVFNVGLTLSFCLYTIGFVGLNWLGLAAVVLTIVYPAVYIKTTDAHRSVSGIVTMLATIALFFVTWDPATFLFIVGNFIGAYLITILIKNGSQWLHAWAAFMFGVGYLAWPLAIVNAANDTPISWLQFGVITAVVGVAAAALTPLLRGLPRTPRAFS